MWHRLNYTEWFNFKLYMVAWMPLGGQVIFPSPPFLCIDKYSPIFNTPRLVTRMSQLYRSENISSIGVKYQMSFTL
jgi:hypothetical protein